MNFALLRKTAFEQSAACLAVSVALIIFPAVIINAFASVPIDLLGDFIARAPWIGKIIRALTGADLSEMMNPNTLGAFAFAHPVIVMLTWGYIVMSTTKVLCGEIDQGTADILLSLPISRTRCYVTVSAWVFLCVPWFVACLWFGVWVGAQTAALPSPLTPWSLRNVAVTDVACLWSVAGIGMFFSALGSRRGRSVGIIFAILVSMFLLNAVAALWPRIQSLAPYSLLYHFRPLVIMRDGVFPKPDFAILLTVAAITWTAGAIIFNRRDIHTG